MPDPESSADRIVASLHNVDEKVNALREQRINDPDDLCDKMFKVAAPTLAGLVFGKLFELAWRKSVGRKAVLPDGTTDKRKELALNLVFGVASAGLGAKQPIPERLVGNPHHRSGRKEASCQNRRAAIYRDRATAVRVCA